MIGYLILVAGSRLHCIISLSNCFPALSSSCHLVAKKHISLTFAHICIVSHSARKILGNFLR